MPKFSYHITVVRFAPGRCKY